MIAPIKETDEPRTSQGLQRAHRLVAATFLKKGPAARNAPPVPAWQAWLFTAWVATVLVAFAGHMLRIF